jgi:hypothetical protein
MIEFFTSEANLLFSIALVAMGVIGIVEGVAVLAGLGLSSFFDTWLPEALFPGGGGDIPDSGALDTPLETHGALTKFLSWLKIGKVPLLMSIVVFLFFFGSMGLGIQAFYHSASTGYLPLIVSGPLALVGAAPLTRMSTGVLAKILPKDESYAITEGSFIGRSATVTTGTARVGAGAQAKVKDEFGQTHYVMVQPDEGEPEFQTGAKVLLVRKEGAAFICIADSTDSIVN